MRSELMAKRPATKVRVSGQSFEATILEAKCPSKYEAAPSRSSATPAEGTPSRSGSTSTLWSTGCG